MRGISFLYVLVALLILGWFTPVAEARCRGGRERTRFFRGAGCAPQSAAVVIAAPRMLQGCQGGVCNRRDRKSVV